MASRKSFTHVLAGLGLATTFFLGCQDFMSQNASSGTATVTDQNTESVSLKLAIKDSGACLELKDRIVAAHAAGTSLGGADSAFAANCIREVRGADTLKVLPPAMIPDDKSRCQWIRTQIDVGRDEMTIKFRHYCPDDCDTLLDKDSAGQVKYCRDPKHDTLPVKPPHHDTDIVNPPKHDTDAINPPKHGPGSPDCDTLKLLMGTTVPGTQIHKDQEADFRLKCTEPPHDTVIVKPPTHDTLPPRNICDSLKLFLSQTTPGTQAHMNFEADFKRLCTEPIHDTVIVKPPVHDTLPPKNICDSLKLFLSQTAPGTQAHMSYEADFKRMCTEPTHDTVVVKPPVVVPPKPNCDSLRLQLSKLDTASSDYARIKHLMGESCPVVVPPKPVPVPVVPPKVNCDELRAKLANTDTTSADYAHLSGSLREHCPVK